MFGECVAVWLVHEWMKMGAPKPLNLVELGPGMATIAVFIKNLFVFFFGGELTFVVNNYQS